MLVWVWKWWFVAKVVEPSTRWKKPRLALATGVDLPALPFLNFDCHNLPRPDHPSIIITNNKQQTDMMLIQMALSSSWISSWSLSTKSLLRCLNVILAILKCDAPQMWSWLAWAVAPARPATPPTGFSPSQDTMSKGDLLILSQSQHDLDGAPPHPKSNSCIYF